MFLFHAAFSLGLIALTGGVALYSWSCKEGKGTCLAKFFGVLVMILSIIGLLCTAYSAVKFRNEIKIMSADMMTTDGKTMSSDTMDMSNTKAKSSGHTAHH